MRIQDRIQAGVHRVFIVEDDGAVAGRLAGSLAAHDCFHVVGHAASLTEAKRRLRDQQPDVALVDLGLPDGSGLELLAGLGQWAPRSLALVITGMGDEASLTQALGLGARGYIHKDDNALDVPQAILDMLAGGVPISPQLARFLIRHIPATSGPGAASLASPNALTAREMEILRTVAKGFTPREMADLEGRSPHTINTHLKNIYRKLEVSSRSAAVFEATQRGWIPPLA